MIKLLIGVLVIGVFTIHNLIIFDFGQRAKVRKYGYQV